MWVRFDSRMKNYFLSAGDTLTLDGIPISVISRRSGERNEELRRFARFMSNGPRDRGLIHQFAPASPLDLLNQEIIPLSGVAGFIITTGRFGSYWVAGFNHNRWLVWVGIRSYALIMERSIILKPNRFGSDIDGLPGLKTKGGLREGLCSSRPYYLSAILLGGIMQLGR